MKRLVICHPKYGHKDVVGEVDIRAEFESIMKAGYGGKVPAVFSAEFADGSVKRYVGDEAAGLADVPGVKEVTVFAPLAGG